MENNQEKSQEEKQKEIKENKKEMMQPWQVEKLSRMIEAALERNEFGLSEEDADEIIRVLTRKEKAYVKRIISQDPLEVLKKNSEIND